MPTYSLLTTVGKNKEAAALANGTPLTISHIAFGNADYAPTGGETALRSELVRKEVQASGLVSGAPNTAFFDAVLEANEGPFTIHEGGAFDSDGDMIAIIKYDPPINKPIPTSGQTVEALMRAHVVFSDLENLVLRIDAINAGVPAERTLDTDEGLGGGGDLGQDRTLRLAFQTLTAINAGQVSSEDQFALFDHSGMRHRKISRDELTTLVLNGAAMVSRTVTEDTVAKLNEEIWCDTSAGPVTVTLPPTPPDGGTVRVFRDGPHEAIVARGTSTIMGKEENITIDLDRLGLQCRANSNDWKHSLLRAGVH